LIKNYPWNIQEPIEWVNEFCDLKVQRIDLVIAMILNSKFIGDKLHLAAP
jgi:hypothetical protein